jgi:hypothetical protein
MEIPSQPAQGQQPTRPKSKGQKTNQILHINIEWKKIEAKQWLSMA